MESEPTFLEKVTDAHNDYIQGDYHSALQKFTKLIDSSKTYDYNLLIYRAYTNWKLNRTAEMLDDADRAMSLAGGRYEAIFLRGKLSNISNPPHFWHFSRSIETDMTLEGAVIESLFFFY